MWSRKKKIVLSICLIIVFIPFLRFHISDMVQRWNYEKSLEAAFQNVFVTERNEVFLLHEAIALTIQTPDAAHYLNAFEIAVRIYEESWTTYEKAESVTAIIAPRSLYCETFYRDIKNALNEKCGEEDLQYIYNLLGDILALYDQYANSVEEVGQAKTLEEFYGAIYLRNEDMELFQILKCLL